MTVTGAVLLYDGDCGFCSASIDWLSRWEMLGVPARTWQSWDADRLPVPVERLATEVVLVEGPAVLGGPDALAAAVRASGSWRRVLGGFVMLPAVRAVARPVYRAVARNRHRLPGGTGACRIR